VKSRRKIVAVLALIMVVSTGWLISSGTKEPEYHERPCREWLKGIGGGYFALVFTPAKGIMPPGSSNTIFVVENGGSQPVDESHAAIGNMGTNAIPFIKPILLSRDSVLRVHLDSWIREHPWLEKHFPLPITQRHRGMTAMYWLGKDAVPFLTEVFKDESTPLDVRRFCAYTFRRYPKDSIKALPALKLAQMSPDSDLSEYSRHAIQAIELGEALRP
jgi:hypothetical protein